MVSDLHDAESEKRKTKWFQRPHSPPDFSSENSRRKILKNSVNENPEFCIYFLKLVNRRAQCLMTSFS